MRDIEHMNDTDLRKLSRAELLELLIDQMEENQRLEKELDAAQHTLEQRQIAIAESGSIAEAALRVNGVFEAAEKAAREYLQNLEKQQQAIFEQTKQQAKEAGMAEARQELTKNAQYIKKLVDFYKANHPQEDL